MGVPSGGPPRISRHQRKKDEKDEKKNCFTVSSSQGSHMRYSYKLQAPK